MALRIQKSWALLGAPKIAGEHNAPRGLGTVVVTSEDLAKIESLGGFGKAVLEAVESEGFGAKWKIVEIS